MAQSHYKVSLGRGVDLIDNEDLDLLQCIFGFTHLYNLDIQAIGTHILKSSLPHIPEKSLFLSGFSRDQRNMIFSLLNQGLLTHTRNYTLKTVIYPEDSD